MRATLLLGQQSSENSKIGVQKIAERLDIPKHYLAKILQQLSKHNIISSVKGPNGGFYLSEKNMEKSLMEVVQCIDGLDAMTTCILGLKECSDGNPCPMHEHITGSRKKILSVLRTSNIRQAVQDVTDNNYVI